MKKALLASLMFARVSILSGPTGPVVYQETQIVATDAFGLFTHVIGTGTPIVGGFNTINWAGSNHYVQLEMDPSATCTGAFQNLGISQF